MHVRTASGAVDIHVHEQDLARAHRLGRRDSGQGRIDRGHLLGGQRREHARFAARWPATLRGQRDSSDSDQYRANQQTLHPVLPLL